MDKNNYYINDPLKDEKEIKVPRKNSIKAMTQWDAKHYLFE